MPRAATFVHATTITARRGARGIAGHIDRHIARRVARRIARHFAPHISRCIPRHIVGYIAGCVVIGVGAWLAARPAMAREPSSMRVPLATDPALTAAELPRVLALGPWPPAAVRDPSNRVSGQAGAIAFGRALFDDTRLSVDGTRSCASCHQRSRGFSDGLPRAEGRRRGDRNTPGLLNVALQRWFGWDGANDNLWAQSLRPLLDAGEMGGSLASVAATVRRQADLRRAYARSFGSDPGNDDEAVAVNVAKALAAFQETLRSGRTPFDDFRDALQRGDREAAARYPGAAQRGLALFLGRGRCASCHSGPNFSNGEFHDIGMPYFAAPGRVDEGRYGGIRALRGSRYNLLGPFNDDRRRSTATGTRHVRHEHRNYGEFKVPSLRNLEHTAPYMHAGSLATLRDVLRHYSELNEERLHTDGERLLVPLKLSATETDDLLAFLESLNERGPAR